MGSAERGVLLLVFEKAGQGIFVLRFAPVRGKPPDEHGNRDGFLFSGCRQGRALGNHELTVREGERLFRCKLQRFGETPDKLGEKMKRAAKEGDIAAYGLAAGETADGLLDHSLQDGDGQILA